MKLSLCGWSLNRLFRREASPLTLLEFPAFARDQFGIDALEINNIYFESTEPAYVDQLRAAIDAAGAICLNIAVDEKGDLSSDDEAARLEAVERYARWLPIAKTLGCGVIRANSGGGDMRDRERAIANCTDSFRRLCELGHAHGVALMMENHWGISADPEVMVRVVEAVCDTHGADAMHTLVDWGNWPDDIDRYAAIERTMPLAIAVHAKVNDIDAELNHPRFDHARCIAIAREAGYDGYLGIEYEGAADPVEGVRRGAMLLRRLLAD